MKRISSVVVVAALALLPMLALAQQQGDPNLSNLQTLLKAIGNLVNLATPIVVGLALLAFFWGLVKYIFSADSDDAKKQGVRLMVGGIIAIFVIVSIVGIVRWIGTSLGVGQGGQLPVPVVDQTP